MRMCVLQGGAGCSSVLQCAAVCCSVLQCVAVCCQKLCEALVCICVHVLRRRVAGYCGVLQVVAV